MKCPLMLTYDVSEAACEHPQPMDCLGESCGFYHKNNARCSTVTLAQGMVYLHKVLLDLASKTPQEG